MTVHAGHLLTIYLVIINLAAFLFYGLDKSRAVHHQWRIPEATLLTYAWIGGGIGSLLGMFMFHHKTRKWKFRVLVPLSIAVWIGICQYLLF